MYEWVEQNQEESKQEIGHWLRIANALISMKSEGRVYDRLYLFIFAGCVICYKRTIFSIKIFCVPKIYLKKMQSTDH